MPLVADILHGRVGSFTNYLTTELNSLANSTSTSTGLKLGAAIDNSSDLYPWITWRFKGNTWTPTTGGFLELYCLPGDAAAGNFAEGSDSIQPQSCYLAWVWPLNPASGAPYHLTQRLPMPRFSKWLFRNKSGAALASASNTLAYQLSHDSIIPRSA